MNYSTFIKEKLVSLINEMDQYHWLFTRNAEKDFSRIKKWSFGEIMRFIISMEGKSLKDELLEHFNFNVDIITNLPLEEFSPEDIKALYHMRWGIETSFRSLKYTIGLLCFHSKKPEFIIQEIFAKLTMYNFTELIAASISIHKAIRKAP